MRGYQRRCARRHTARAAAARDRGHAVCVCVCVLARALALNNNASKVVLLHHTPQCGFTKYAVA